MIVQEGFPSLVGRTAEPAQDARDSAFGDGDAQHFQFAMNPGCAPQRIGGGHLLDQLAEFCSGTGATSPPALRLRKPGSKFAEPFALPTNDGIWLDIEQRTSPVGSHAAERDPK